MREKNGFQSRRHRCLARCALDARVVLGGAHLDRSEVRGHVVARDHHQPVANRDLDDLGLGIGPERLNVANPREISTLQAFGTASTNSGHAPRTDAHTLGAI